MKSKIKGGFSILLMSLIFYCMITTKYTHALGDYIVEFVGLNSWTGNYSGFHLTIIYFGIPFIISLLEVERYVVSMNISRIRVFLVFIVLMTIFYLLTGLIVSNIKKNSPGLLSIAFNPENSSINYSTKDKELVEFTDEFELINYSNEKRTFYISIDRYLYRQDGIEAISFYTINGEKAVFQLEGNETKFFSLNLNDYKVVGGRRFQNGSESGTIEEIVLTDDEGDKVILNRNNGFIAESSRCR
jgi:hypothetical protein